jgi:hypothetical protein
MKPPGRDPEGTGLPEGSPALKVASVYGAKSRCQGASGRRTVGQSRNENAAGHARGVLPRALLVSARGKGQQASGLQHGLLTLG